MVNGLADLLLMPMRRQLGKARRPLPTSIGHTAPPAPTTLGEGLAQVAAATADDAAHRAANGAFRIDQGENFLRDERRWRGYEDGEASFYLAPGVVLHYGSTEDRYGRDHHFTLLTGDGDQPVTITSLEQIRHSPPAPLASRSPRPRPRPRPTRMRTTAPTQATTSPACTPSDRPHTPRPPTGRGRKPQGRPDPGRPFPVLRDQEIPACPA